MRGILVPVLKLVGGVVVGRVLQQQVQQRLDPGPRPAEGGGLIGGGAAVTDDVITIGGFFGALAMAVRAASTAQSRKWTMFWVGVAAGFANSPIDAITAKVQGAIGQGEG